MAKHTIPETNKNPPLIRGGSGWGSLTFTLTRLSSSAEGTRGRMVVRTAEGEATFDTIERRCPNDRAQTYRNLCLPPGKYNLSVMRAMLDFEGTPKFYPWLYLPPQKGFPDCALYSYNSTRETGAGVIQYGHNNDFGLLSHGYEACKEMFLLIRPYLDARTYEWTEPATLEIIEPVDMLRKVAKRWVAEENTEFTLEV